jgi:hypothetical protein
MATVAVTETVAVETIETPRMAIGEATEGVIVVTVVAEEVEAAEAAAAVEVEDRRSIGAWMTLTTAIPLLVRRRSTSPRSVTFKLTIAAAKH